MILMVTKLRLRGIKTVARVSIVARRLRRTRTEPITWLRQVAAPLAAQIPMVGLFGTYTLSVDEVVDPVVDVI